MKKLLIVLGVLILMALVIGGFHLWNNRGCTDGGATWYFNNQFISLPDSDLEKHVVASSEYNHQKCERIYQIKEGELQKEVAKDKFSKFLQDYNENCNNCLIFTERYAGQNMIYVNYSTKEKIQKD